MRILVLSNLYPPNVVGGYERLCHAAASELARAIQESVYGRFGIRLEPEPVVV